MQIFHALRTIKRGLRGGVANAFEQPLAKNSCIRAYSFCKQVCLVEAAFPLPCRMQRHRYDDIEALVAQSFIIESSTKPACYKMTQVCLAVVFEFVDDIPNDSAATVCSNRNIEVDRAMRTIRAAKRRVD